MHKCDGCFWKTDWEGDNDSYPICERLYIFSFKEAKDECAKPGVCEYYITHEEVNQIADKMNEIPN